MSKKYDYIITIINSKEKMYCIAIVLFKNERKNNKQKINKDENYPSIGLLSLDTTTMYIVC